LQETGGRIVSVAVSANKVEGLCQLKCDLMANGVPAERVGLLHSYKFEPGREGDGYASLASTDENEERPFMLVTHQRIKGDKRASNLKQYACYRGEPRNLLIWDESLITSESKAISKIDLESAIGALKPRLRRNGEDHPLVRYFEEAIQLVGEELTRQAGGEQPKPISLRPLRWDHAREYRAIIGNHPESAALQDLLAITSDTIRVIKAGPQGEGLVTCRPTIPPELATIAVLDASYPVRELTKYDTIIVNEDCFPKNVKRYDKVTLHLLPFGAGRDTMTRLFTPRKREERLVTAEIAELINSRLPADQGVLLFTFKTREFSSSASPRPVDFRAILEGDLRAAGVDLAQTVKVKEEHGSVVERPRFVILTWGNETSVSKYGYCRHIIFVGVLHRSNLDIAAYIVGQIGDRWAEVTPEAINDALIGETAHSLYQAMSRGACRKVKGNRAEAMDAWLIYPRTKFDKLNSKLREAMPGLRWTAWKPRYLTGEAKLDDAVRQIMNALEAVPPSLPRISTRALKASMPALQAIPRRTFTRAAEEVGEWESSWRFEDRSFLRADFEYYFGSAQ
jgi:hypothetical protein